MAGVGANGVLSEGVRTGFLANTEGEITICLVSKMRRHKSASCMTPPIGEAVGRGGDEGIGIIRVWGSRSDGAPESVFDRGTTPSELTRSYHLLGMDVFVASDDMTRSLSSESCMTPPPTEGALVGRRVESWFAGSSDSRDRGDATSISVENAGSGSHSLSAAEESE